uniref:Uncharacterized protein n=1 Tax=Anguilla anguilla TaxID=7936 RepID=A0A0E9T6D4_ANGAN
MLETFLYFPSNSTVSLKTCSSNVTLV